MKEQEIIEWIKQKYEATEGFALEQGPLYFQELIKYEIITSIMWVCLTSLLLAGIGAFVIKFHKQIAKLDDAFLAILLLCLLVVLVFCFDIIFDGVDGLIKACSAPRVLILEHIKNL